MDEKVKVCTNCVNYGWNMPQCKFCNAKNDYKHYEYKYNIGTIEHYKDKACEVARNRCDKCEAAQEYNGELCCAFDTVNRFIEWCNKYNS